MGTMAVMSDKGDSKTIWNKDNPAEVAAAKATYDALKEKGYLAFSVKDKGEKGSLVMEFDPNMESLIMSPPVAGG